MLTYTFLDQIIWKAYKVPHLPYEQLPPQADYDYATNLVKRAFPQLDPFQRPKKRHLFFGIMTVFTKEYSIMAVMLLIRVWLLVSRGCTRRLRECRSLLRSPALSAFTSSFSKFRDSTRCSFLTLGKRYLESGGEGAVVRPWVWIAWLFLGPVIGAMAIQTYVFITVTTTVLLSFLCARLTRVRRRVCSSVLSRSSPNLCSTTHSGSG